MPTKQREQLNEYTRASRDIELTEIAITILEKVNGSAARLCVARLKRSQKRHLDRIDKFAALLGAPYPK